MPQLPLSSAHLDNLNRQCRHLNVFPIYLPIYMHRTDANPISPILKKLVQECMESLACMSAEEVRHLVSTLPQGVSTFIEIDDSTDVTKSSFHERVSVYYLVNESTKSYLSFREIIRRSNGDAQAYEEYPELRQCVDKAGLLRLDDRFELHDGGIFYRDHVLHYHQFLRRGFTSNPNFDFLGRFISYFSKTNGANTFRIAIDPLRLMPKEHFVQIAEFDAWFGPDFDRSKLDDINEVGLTVKKRIQPSIFALTNSIDRTEFFWSHRDGIKTLEIEEVSDIRNTYDTYNINRYAHCERHVEAGVLRHFDGAVKVYKQGYSARCATQLPTAASCDNYIKLFRIDGNIDIDRWIDLSAHFFKGNEMILEYFDPSGFEREFGARQREYRDVKQRQKAPNASTSSDAKLRPSLLLGPQFGAGCG